MATIYNSELSKELIQGAKIQTGRENIPTQLADKVVPVMEVNPKLLRRTTIVKQGSAINATGVNIFTTNSDQDFYLCGITMSLIKDATSTSAWSQVTGTINGLATSLIRIISLSLTSQSAQQTVMFDKPIKLDKNTAMAIGNSTNVANISSTATIYGYYDEYSNA